MMKRTTSFPALSVWPWILLAGISLVPAFLVLGSDAFGAPLPSQSGTYSEGRFQEELLKKEISRAYASSKVELLGPIQWVRPLTPGLNPALYTVINLVGDDEKGSIHFIFSSETGSSHSQPALEGWVRFSAKVPARVAQRRIFPGEKLSPSVFEIKDIEVSQGPGRQYRGVILSPETEISSFESIQTVLEGQFLLSSAVRKIPSVRRGDTVRILLVSGDLTVSTQGIAQEPGYVENTIKALTLKNKREVSGILKADGVVEVKL